MPLENVTESPWSLPKFSSSSERITHSVCLRRLWGKVNLDHLVTCYRGIIERTKCNELLDPDR